MLEQLSDCDCQYVSTDLDIWIPVVYMFLINHCSASFVKEKNKAASELHDGDLAWILNNKH